MSEALRVILYFLFLSIGLMLIASGIMWWLEATRHLTRTLNRILEKNADAFLYDVSCKKAAGLEFTAGDLAIIWDKGEHGYVFSFDEIEGAELIVDEKVVARAQLGETRRVLNETHAGAHKVVLRLMFNDVELPEFEITLFGEVVTQSVFPKTASEAVRLGRKWLSHIDAVIKRHPDAPQPANTETKAGAKDDESPPWDE